LQTGQPSQTESALQYPILKFVICFAAPATISNASSGILKKRISSSVSSSPIEVFFIVLNPVIFAVTEIGRAATCKHHDPMLNLRRGCQNNAITGDGNCPKGACLRRCRFARLRGRKQKGNQYKWGNLFSFCLILAGFI
jgi:hypothetical protein